MNIAFMGTPDFAVPTLEKLHEDRDISIKYVVTKYDSKSKRGQEIIFSPVKNKALEYNIEILQPLKIKDDREVIAKLRNADLDFIIVVAYGEILSKEILDIPKCACINGHASLLPKYRGASPIQSAILYGDKVTGTTSMLMDVGLDTGDILEQSEIEIEDKETSDSLFEKLSYLTADTVYHTIKNFDKIRHVKQDDSKSSKSCIIKKEFGEIDFKNEDAAYIERKVRAYTSWPSAYIYIDSIQHKIWDVDVIDSDVNLDGAFKITDDVYVLGKEIYARCKDGIIRINEIQKSGKNRLKARDFINGLKI